MSIDQLIFVLHFAPLVLEVQNGTTLRMVERGGTIEETENEGDEYGAGDGLQAESAKGKCVQAKPVITFG